MIDPMGLSGHGTDPQLLENAIDIVEKPYKDENGKERIKVDIKVPIRFRGPGTAILIHQDKKNGDPIKIMKPKTPNMKPKTRLNIEQFETQIGRI